jgi:cytochrome c biogenesis protein CcmG/thiol:disulfide interchange protein DsbE
MNRAQSSTIATLRIRLTGLIAPMAFLFVFFGTGCDRGSHPGQIGEAAPDFVVRDGSQTVRLSAYRGRVVLLVFWASWCQPCLEELPSLEELQRRMPQVVVLTVSTDEDEAAYRQFLADNRVDLLSVRDPAQASNHLYGTYRFPESYIIDQRGVIRRRFIGPQDWTNPEIVSYLQHI